MKHFCFFTFSENVFTFNRVKLIFIILNIQATNFSLQSFGETIGGSTTPETSRSSFIMTEKPQQKQALCVNMSPSLLHSIQNSEYQMSKISERPVLMINKTNKIHWRCTAFAEILKHATSDKHIKTLTQIIPFINVLNLLLTDLGFLLSLFIEFLVLFSCQTQQVDLPSSF